MKRIAISGGAVILALTIFYSCQKNAGTTDSKSINSTAAENSVTSRNSETNCYDYQITMTRSYDNGKTTFVWRIINPVPGNGNNGTQKDLSHWGFKPECEGGEDLNYHPEDILAAYYSYNNMQNWTQILPTPTIKNDPSSRCMAPEDQSFKFDFGTRGSSPTYYKLVLDGNWSEAGPNGNGGFVKAGTSCCRLSSIPGVGCKQL